MKLCIEWVLLIGRSVGWLVGWLVGWSVGWLVDWLVGRFVFYLFVRCVHALPDVVLTWTDQSLTTHKLLTTYIYTHHTHIIDTKSSNKAVLYNLLAMRAASGNRDLSVYMKCSTKHRVCDLLFSFLCSSPVYIPTDFLSFHSVISQQFSSHFLAFHISRLSHSCQHEPCSTDCWVIRVNVPHFYNLQTEFSCN